MKRCLVVLIVSCISTVTPPLYGQASGDQDEAARVEAVHDELRALRGALTDAIEKGDVPRQLDHAHQNVIVVWQNGDVARGRDGLLAFLDRGGSDVFRGYEVPPTADDLTVLHGDDAGVVSGISVARYKLWGIPFKLHNRWSATVVRQDDRWLIASYHVSANILRNPVLSWAIGLTGVAGVLVGLAVGAIARKLRRKKPAA